MKLPPAFKLLLDESNPAADAALVEALPHLEPAIQAVALEILVQRAHTPSLAAVVGKFDQGDDLLQQSILVRAGDLTAGIRSAITASTFDGRANAIEVIVRSDDTKSAYLLADALHARSARTRERAAIGLGRLVDRLLDRFEDASTAEDVNILQEQAERLAETLAMGVNSWESHFRPEVLRAALLLGDRTEPAVLQELTQRRTKLQRMFGEVLRSSSDPRLAGAAVRALAVPELRPAAVEAITRGNLAYIQGVFSHAWLLADLRIERGCRWVRHGPWVRVAIQALTGLNGANLRGAVRFLAATGGPAEKRAGLLRELLCYDREEVRRATFWQLMRQDGEPAGELLRTMAARAGGSLAPLARRELQRRHMTAIVQAPTVASQMPSGGNDQHRAVFEQYWNRYDGFEANERRKEGQTLRTRVTNIDLLLRAKLTSSDPLDRARAVRVISSLGLVREMGESLFRTASDPDPIVRSLIVSALMELPGPVTERLLRAAVSDPDERVQADAIEALDALDVAERVSCTEPKLESPNNRVRANAVKSLLRTDHRKAGETLLDMLEDSVSAHRLGALWVVEQLRLRSVADRILQMSRSDPDDRVKRRAKRVWGDLDRAEEHETPFTSSAFVGREFE